MLEIYKASCENVRELKSKRKILNKIINRTIREGSDTELEALTKLYALLFSAYAEVSFLKLINTPYGFTQDEIDEIQKQRNLEEKWLVCFDFCFKKIINATNLGEVANKQKRLRKILDSYIIAPSRIRNKIAHGQWKVCLNNQCDGLNAQITTDVQQLDCVRIDVFFEIYERFQQCVEDLIESVRTHYRDYYTRIVDLEEYIEKTKGWNLESKTKSILESEKYKRENNRCMRNNKSL